MSLAWAAHFAQDLLYGGERSQLPIDRLDRGLEHGAMGGHMRDAQVANGQRARHLKRATAGNPCGFVGCNRRRLVSGRFVVGLLRFNRLTFPAAGHPYIVSSRAAVVLVKAAYDGGP